MSPQFHARRELGRTGFCATQLGFGDIADRNVPLAECVKTIHRALDAGLNLIDTAPSYEAGYSEEIVGAALQGRRDGVFLIDKIDDLENPVAPQVEASLKRLGTRPDLFVFHGVSTLEQWRKLRFDELTGRRGISCHNPEILRVAISSQLCDVVMFPVGAYVDDRYVTEILPLARQHQVGTVCFKTFGAGKLLGDTEGYNQPLSNRPRGKLSSGGSDTGTATLPRLSVAECLHYTLTLDPDVTLLGMSFPNEQDAAFASARDFTPLMPAQMEALKRRAVEAVRDKGRIWWNPVPKSGAVS
jgi:aryl-alcohol dehydrogenase-like predicted oxidoreductase